MESLLILVNENDEKIGVADKRSVHQSGQLHRAFSIFIFNKNKELLLQQRASDKYHSGGLWSNTCCSHPNMNEAMEDAVNRRLEEEMGIQCPVNFKFKFIYKAQLDNGLTEHEYDHVYFGRSDDLPILNPNEVENWRYISLEALQKEIEINPEIYSAWFKICLPQVIGYWKAIKD